MKPSIEETVPHQPQALALEHTLDLRSAMPPVVLLRVHRYLSTQKGGSGLAVHVTDEDNRAELEALCTLQGYRFESADETPDGLLVYVRR